MWYIKNEKAFIACTVSKYREVCWKTRQSPSFLKNFEVFWDCGKELFRVLYVASQTNQYLKRKSRWKLAERTLATKYKLWLILLWFSFVFFSWVWEIYAQNFSVYIILQFLTGPLFKNRFHYTDVCQYCFVCCFFFRGSCMTFKAWKWLPFSVKNQRWRQKNLKGIANIFPALYSLHARDMYT